MENSEIKDLLEQEIKAELADLATATPGSEEQEAIVDNVVKLYKLRIDEMKVILEHADKGDARTGAELEEAARYEERKLDRIINAGVKAAEIILPLLFYATWMNKGFRFEENGTYTSTTFKGLFNRFRPTK
jgi:hypothetical protein